jgi:mRNA interferase HigB
MKLISNRVLREFAARPSDAEAPLQAWRRLIEKGDFANFAALRAVFASADKVGNQIVFNIGGHKFRLIAAVLFSPQQVFVKAVLTHADYDKGDWK